MGELSNDLGLVTVKKVNKDDRAFSQSYFLSGGEPTDLREVQSVFEAPEYETTVGIDLGKLSPETIAAQIAEAKKPRQIPDWYPDKDSLYRAVESIPPFGIYKDNYIVTGTSFSGGRVTKDNSDAKYQISLPHRLIKSILPLHTYLFLTYTQKSFWEIYKDSKPFYENN